MYRLVAGLVLLAVVQLAGCWALLWPPWRHADRLFAWLITSVGTAFLALMSLLGLRVLGVRVPLWIGLAVLVGLNGAVGWVLVLLIRARRRRIPPLGLDALVPPDDPRYTTRRPG